MVAKRRGRHEATVELTPLIDVVFLLLIFFMVSTTFIRETQLKIDLPEASGDIVEEQITAVEVIVNRSNNYVVDGRMLQETDVESLVAALEAARESRAEDDRRLVITADARALHEAVVKAMDAAGRVGLINISITTAHPEDGD